MIWKKSLVKNKIIIFILSGFLGIDWEMDYVFIFFILVCIVVFVVNFMCIVYSLLNLGFSVFDYKGFFFDFFIF